MHNPKLKINSFHQTHQVIHPQHEIPYKIRKLFEGNLANTREEDALGYEEERDKLFIPSISPYNSPKSKKKPMDRKDYKVVYSMGLA